MTYSHDVADRIQRGERIDAAAARRLYDEPLAELTAAANGLREVFCGNGFDICTIINARSGKCSENCKFCAQSSFYHTSAEEYPMLGSKEIVGAAVSDASKGVLRFSIVTSGRKLRPIDVDHICATVRAIHEKTDVNVCASIGLCTRDQFDRMKAAGLTRFHCNLETSRRFFPQICTTHTYDQKIESLKAARAAGLSLCCGGIMGLGETVEDRIDMAIDIRELGVRSVPVNFLNPIPGTPFEKNRLLDDEERMRIVAVYRFINPEAAIRLAGGRGLIADKGRACFRSGANAVISGDMLTTAGYSIETDMEMIDELGYKPELCHD